VTGQPISGSTTASATASLQTIITNNTAVITNTESLQNGSSSAFRFSVDSVSGASGSFSNYTLGTQTSGPVTWTSSSQSSSGSVTFNKTVYLVSAEPIVTSDTLTDVSSLTASNGFVTSDESDIAAESDGLATLTINTSISFTPSASDGAQTFTFDVTDSSGNAVLVSDGNGNFVSPSVSIGVGQTSGATTVPGLANGQTYTVHEEQTAGYDAPPADQQVSINIQPGDTASCGQSYNVSFVNTIHAAVTVQKISQPAGSESGWTFQLFDPGNNQISSVTTTGSGAIAFPVNLTQEGTYTIKEVGKSPWYQTASTSGTLTVDFPGSGSQTIAAQFTNTKCVAPTVSASSGPSGAAIVAITAKTPPSGTGLIGGSLSALNPLPLGTQVSSTGANGVGVKVVKLTNATMPASSWLDGAGSLSLTANKVNVNSSASIGVVATSLGGTPATVTVSGSGTVTVTNAGVCSTAFDPLLTSAIRQAGAPQTDTYNGIDQSEGQLTIYNGTPGDGTMIVKVNGTTFSLGALKDGEQRTLDISSALGPGDNTISVTATGKPGGSAVLLVAPK
jgi:hypothetical protein